MPRADEIAEAIDRSVGAMQKGWRPEAYVLAGLPTKLPVDCEINGPLRLLFAYWNE
jgi:hypothetical protein